MMEMEKQMDDKGKDVGMEYMGVLAKAQEKTKSAHVVLSGINAIKSADVKPSDLKQARVQKASKKPKSGGGGGGGVPSGGFDTTVNTMMGLASAIPL